MAHDSGPKGFSCLNACKNIRFKIIRYRAEGMGQADLEASVDPCGFLLAPHPAAPRNPPTKLINVRVESIFLHNSLCIAAL